MKEKKRKEGRRKGKLTDFENWHGFLRHFSEFLLSLSSLSSLSVFCFVFSDNIAQHEYCLVWFFFKSLALRMFFLSSFFSQSSSTPPMNASTSLSPPAFMPIALDYHKKKNGEKKE
jgi:hypothetical protein